MKIPPTFMHILVGYCFANILLLSIGRTSADAFSLRSEHVNRELKVDVPTPTHRFPFEGTPNDVISGVVGDLQDSASYSTVAIEGNKSLQLPCCNSCIRLNNPSFKNGFKNYTIAVWFQADSIAGYRYLYEEGGATNGIAIRLNGAKLEAAAIESGGGVANVKVATANTTIMIGKWHLALAVYSNGVLSIALDGVLSGNVRTGFADLAYHGYASIGGPGLTDFNKTGKNFIGLLDDVRIWDGTSLNADQVRQLYRDVVVPPVTSTTINPSHQWRFESTATDTRGGADGVLQGPASYSLDAVEGTKSLKLLCCNASVILDSPLLQNSFIDYTIALWFNAKTINGYRYMYEEGGSGSGIAIRLNGATLEAAVIKNGGGVANVKVASGGNVTLKTWHLAVAVYKNGILSIALDGTFKGRADTGFGEIGDHGVASIGGPGLTDYNKVGNNFDGLIDDVRIWEGTSLNADQVRDLYSQAIPIVPTQTPKVPSPTKRPTSPPNLSPSSPPPVIQSRSPTRSPTKTSTPPPFSRGKYNIVLFVADDMNFDSPGFMGGVAPNVTPNLDKLASQGMVFSLAHAAVSVCQPSRQAMLSGKYPPNYGSVDFWPMAEGTPTVVTNLKEAGYLTASFYKIYHMLPVTSFPWDMTETNTILQGREKGTNGVLKEIGRSPSMMAEATRQTIAAAQKANKPFFLVINSADPHRPFHGVEAFLNSTTQLETPSRVYQSNEVRIPNPLPDLPGIREDVAQYASSMRRLDDTIGRCLAVLENAGVANNTIVMFVSDNGMPMPFAKFETYRDGYNGPLVVRWPGRIQPGTKDSTNLVSLTDIAPTIVDIAGAQPLPDIFGRSLLPLIDRKRDVVWRDVVVGNRYEDIYYGNMIKSDLQRQKLRTQGWVDAPDHMNPGTMRRTCNKRSITDGTYHYIYNHFYDSFRAKNLTSLYEYQIDPSFQAMQAAASTNANVSARVNFYTFRAKEEFYNIRVDPGSYVNLIGRADMQKNVKSLKQKLLKWMKDTDDPQLSDFEKFVNSTV